MILSPDITTAELLEHLDELWRERELYVTPEVRARLVARMDPWLEELATRLPDAVGSHQAG